MFGAGGDLVIDLLAGAAGFSSAQSSSEMPIVTVRTSRFSSLIIRIVSRISLVSNIKILSPFPDDQMWCIAS